jgi:TonB family protein
MRSIIFLTTIGAALAFSPLVQAGQVAVPDKYKGIILSAPEPDHTPKITGGRYIVSGRGVYRLNINQKTGTVEEVGVLNRAGNKMLDSEAVVAFMQWKFRPGTFKQLDVPVIFERTVDVQLKNAAGR